MSIDIFMTHWDHILLLAYGHRVFKKLPSRNHAPTPSTWYMDESVEKHHCSNAVGWE